MRPGKEKVYPILLGAVPVILVLMLAVFLFSGGKVIPAQNGAQPQQGPSTGSPPTANSSGGPRR